MDFVSVLLVLAPLLAICLFILALLKQRQSGDTTGETDNAGRGDGQVVQPARRAAVVRNRGRARMAGGVDADGDDEEPSAVAPSDGKIGAKKMAKLQAKAEKKTQRESEQRDREERKKRAEQEAAEARQREQEADQLEQARAEAERLEREERERREHEEYLKMREAFGVEEEGYDEQMEQEQENLLQQFINHIKRVKVVLLEDLAARFKLKTQDAIDRLQTLMQEGKLTGVIDDRGKFIYIPHGELEAVATFVRRRGRVSLTDLVESSNTLISLLPEVST